MDIVIAVGRDDQLAGRRELGQVGSDRTTVQPPIVRVDSAVL
jgi:hypothetical protein